ncbi:MAG: methyl-accepting chemotaxis protein [Oscillospiraceae bacterium]|jgi:methyl-accepting chemotaxis protein|nr:methyl-accepting chemotaxis protein [Oscillospiraceae bacterium]
MKNLRISQKLFVGFLVVTLLSVLLAGLGIFSNTSINGDYTYLLEGPIERERYLRDLQYQFTMMRYRTANYIMNSGDAEYITNTAAVQFSDAYAIVDQNLTAYVASCENATGTDPAVIQGLVSNADQLDTMLTQYIAMSEITKQLSIEGDAKVADASLKDAIPLTTEINTLIGEMLIPSIDLVRSESERMDAAANILTIVLIAVTVICVVISIALALYISGSISKPLTVIKDALHRLGTSGELKMNEEDRVMIGKYGKYEDEIGQVIRNTVLFVDRIVEVSRELEEVSEGDLTLDIVPLSERDTMGNALHKMVMSLGDMFTEIRRSTLEVANEAKQLADGSQTLAQGSTEQAASIEQLSSSIAEIANKTQQSAAMADQAAVLANTIKGNAEKGSLQMGEMMSAVKEINTASHNISKVIKAIEDIAFQTNILALNASVEAARAGQHGKGFAVVAEEVRNLATKSSDAAHDTGALIANSIEKAELGARIAGETSASLTEIVAGINESSQLVGEIAKSSEEQRLGIAQINKGIDQVAQVIQQNSATAEESAAASQQMSSQSHMLEEMIDQFKLKDEKAKKGFGGPSPKRPIAMPEKTEYTANGDFGKY